MDFTTWIPAAVGALVSGGFAALSWRASRWAAGDMADASVSAMQAAEDADSAEVAASDALRRLRECRTHSALCRSHRADCVQAARQVADGPKPCDCSLCRPAPEASAAKLDEIIRAAGQIDDNGEETGPILSL